MRGLEICWKCSKRLLPGLGLGLVLAAPLDAGIGDWWDLVSGRAAAEQIRLEREAERETAFAYVNRLRNVHDAVATAIRTLGPEDIDALETHSASSSDIDGLRLPDRDKRASLKALNLPGNGVGGDGVRLRWCEGYLYVWYDPDEMSFDLPPARIRGIVYDAVLNENRGRYSHDRARGIARDRSGQGIEDGRVVQTTAPPADIEDCMVAQLPDDATLLRTGYIKPRLAMEKIRVGDCPAGYIGEGLFAVHNVINGVRRSAPIHEYQRCHAKPDPGESTWVWEPKVPQQTCHEGNRDWWLGVVRKSDGKVDYARGDFAERRKGWTYTESFPADWKMEDLVLTWTDPWEIETNTCYAQWVKTERRTPGCPAGQTGDHTQTRAIAHTDYANPATQDTEATESWTTVSNTCRTVQPTPATQPTTPGPQTEAPDPPACNSQQCWCERSGGRFGRNSDGEYCDGGSMRPPTGTGNGGNNGGDRETREDRDKDGEYDSTDPDDGDPNDCSRCGGSNQ